MRILHYSVSRGEIEAHATAFGTERNYQMGILGQRSAELPDKNNSWTTGLPKPRENCLASLLSHRTVIPQTLYAVACEQGPHEVQHGGP